MTSPDSWAEQRSAAAAEHLQRLQQRQAQEHSQAQEFLDTFVQSATARGLLPEPLRVWSYSGRRSARTRLTGWYLRKNRKAGVDIDGNFYLLIAPLTLREVLFGFTPASSDPPLVLGAGGRDGDSITLQASLNRLLPGWDKK